MYTLFIHWMTTIACDLTSHSGCTGMLPLNYSENVTCSRTCYTSSVNVSNTSKIRAFIPKRFGVLALSCAVSMGDIHSALHITSVRSSRRLPSSLQISADCAVEISHFHLNDIIPKSLAGLARGEHQPTSPVARSPQEFSSLRNLSTANWFHPRVKTFFWLCVWVVLCVRVRALTLVFGVFCPWNAIASIHEGCKHGSLLRGEDA